MSAAMNAATNLISALSIDNHKALTAARD